MAENWAIAGRFFVGQWIGQDLLSAGYVVVAEPALDADLLTLQKINFTNFYIVI